MDSRFWPRPYDVHSIASRASRCAPTRTRRTRTAERISRAAGAQPFAICSRRGGHSTCITSDGGRSQPCGRCAWLRSAHAGRSSPPRWRWLFVLAAFMTPVVAQSLTDDDRGLEQIQEILSRDGPYSIDLLGPLSRLGLIYQEGEDYALALVTLERAQHIVRINKGLHSMEQVPLVRQLIALKKRAVITKAPGTASRLADAAAAPSRRRADRARCCARSPTSRWRCSPPSSPANGRPRSFSAASTSSGRRSEMAVATAGSKSTVVQGMLAEAQRTYLDAIAVMLRQGLYDSDDLRALELEVLRGVDLMRSRYYKGPTARPVPMAPRIPGRLELGAVAQPHGGRRSARGMGASVSERAVAGGRRRRPRRHETSAHHGSVSSRPAEPSPPLCVRRRELEFAAAASGRRRADGRLGSPVFAQWPAIESYEVARAMLEQAGAAESSVEQLFAPPTPVVLPAFQPNPLARDETRAATGYIDVAFEITKYGRSRAVEILDAANATHAAKQDLRGPHQDQPVPAAADGRRIRRRDAGPHALLPVRMSRVATEHDRAVRRAVPSRPPPRTIPVPTARGSAALIQ